MGPAPGGWCWKEVWDWDFARACVCERVCGGRELAVLIVLAAGLERPDDVEDCWEEEMGRRVVADVRLVTVDLDREWPMSRLEAVVGGGPPDDLGRLVVVVAVRVVDVPAVVVEDGG